MSNSESENNNEENVIEVDNVEQIKRFEPKDAMKKELRSIVWQFFHFQGTEEKGADTSATYCNLCNKRFSYHSATTTMSDHLKADHDKEYSEAEQKSKEKASKLNLITNYTKTSDTAPQWKTSSNIWKTATAALAKWLCESSREINLVNDKGFHDFIRILNSQYGIPSDTTISNYISDLYEEMKEKTIKDLEKPEFISVTTDGGSSSNSVSYVDVNAHYVDQEKFTLESRVLGVRKVEGLRNTAEDYREHVDDVLDEFHIKDKVVKFVSDNENKMKASFKDDERNGCSVHGQHNTVKTGLKSSEEVQTVLEKARRIAQMYNQSNVFRRTLAFEQKALQITERVLHQDVETRWGSTKTLLGSILDHPKDRVGEDSFKNREAINKAMKGCFKKEVWKKWSLSLEDMIKIQNLFKFLTSFDVFTTTLGGNKFVTSSIVLPVIKSVQLLLTVKAEDPDYIKVMKRAMLEDYKARVRKDLSHKSLALATALDPRFKKLKVVEDKEMRELVFKELELQMRDLWLKEIEEAAVDRSNDEEEVESSAKKRKLGIEFNESSSEEEEGDERDEVKIELANYRKVPEIDRDLDPLDWWRANHAKYKYLTRLMFKYLCIPATSTEAERVFSSLGNLLTKKRLCMTGANVNKQLFLRDKLRKA